MQGVQIARRGLGWGQPLHALTAVTKRFAEPEGIGRFQAAAAQALAHLVYTTSTGIGEHGQGAGALLQALSEGCWVAAMQAEPLRVLPGPAQSGKCQLQGRGAWMKAQTFASQALDQDPADPEPQGITAGQHYRALIAPEGQQLFA